MKLKLFLYFALIVVMSSIVTVPASAVDNSEIWSKKTTNTANKSWTINFNMPVNKKSASSSTIFVVDNHNRVFPTTLLISEDGFEVTISPSQTYELNKEYRLIIERTVRSTSSKDLRKNLVMPFQIIPEATTSSSGLAEKNGSSSNSTLGTDSEVSPLQITVTLNDYLAEFTVKADESIVEVRIGNDKMHYTGNNSFNLGLAGVEEGTTLLIKGYDHNQKLVAKERYKVKLP